MKIVGKPNEIADFITAITKSAENTDKNDDRGTTKAIANKLAHRVDACVGFYPLEDLPSIIHAIAELYELSRTS